MFDADQIQAVTDVLLSGKVNCWTGSITNIFEQEFASSVKAYAIAMANGSLALSSSYLAAGLGPGDELITPAFIATASSAVLLGAKPVLLMLTPILVL